MYPLIETIKVENGVLMNLHFHQERLDRSLYELFGADDKINLGSEIQIPAHAQGGKYKCRVLYGKNIGKIEFIKYQPRKIFCLKIVYDDSIEYHLKFSDRSNLEKLLQQKGYCDDILIVKNGLITDTSYSNIVFFNGKKWVTPDSPLLKGTKRSFLLSRGNINLGHIRIDDLTNYSGFLLINAMLDFKEERLLPIENIIH